MAKSNRAKATDIPAKVKNRVWERDEHRCINCGATYTAMPNAHRISRNKGGLGIEQNVVTLCRECHHNMDNGYGEAKKKVTDKVTEYLAELYPEWTDEDVTYRKWAV